MAERPIIRVLLPGDTAGEFQRAATQHLAREFFVELDTPVAEQVRIEAPFKSGAIAVRAEATTTAATRDGRSGVLVRLTKLEPTSYGVAIPPASAWPRPEDVIEVRRKPDGPAIARTATPVARPTVPRTATPHVVRRAPSVIDDARPSIEVEADEPDPSEFGVGASITKNSPVSADLAKQLNERPTPPRTPAIIRRQTPPVGVPPVPKPVLKVTPPSTPPIDDEWSFDSPTLGPAEKPVPSSSRPTPPSFPAIAKPTPPPFPAVKPPSSATPSKGVPSIGARPPVTPAKGQPTFTAPTKPVIDDDAAFDSAFAMFEDDDLAIPVEPAAKPPEATFRARAEEITQPVPAPATEPSATKPELAAKPTRPATAPGETKSTRPATAPGAAKPDAADLAKSTRPATAPGAAKPEAADLAKSTRPATAPGAAKPEAADLAKSTRPATAPGAAKAAVAPDVAKSTRPITAPGAVKPEDVTKPTRPATAPGAAKSEAAADIAAQVAPTLAASAPLAPSPRASSEGVLATARASELALPRNEIDPVEQATSTGALATSRTGSETALKPRSKLPLIVGVIAVAIGIVVAVVLATGGGGSKPTTPPPPSNKAEVDKHLSTAASRIADGKLVGRGGDAALDHLLAAKALAPDDPQVVAQLRALADTFEKLGDGALAANDLAEAATHYQAALSAEPARASAKTKLADVENRARGSAR